MNSLVELTQKVKTALTIIDVSMFKRSWMELEYGLDILRATKESHIEVYQGSRKKNLIVLKYCCNYFAVGPLFFL